jgi:hypothetical protein
MKQKEDDLDKKAWKVFRDALKNVELPNYVTVSEKEDGTVSFTLSISYQNGCSAFILFEPEIETIKKMLTLGSDDEMERVPYEFAEEFGKRYATLVAHLFLKNFHIEIEETIAGLSEIPLIMPQLAMAEMYSNSPSISKDKKVERSEQMKAALESLLEERKQRTKKRILDDIEKPEKPYQPAKHLISIYYEELLPKWEQAKLCYKKNKTFNNWEKMVAVSFEDFPTDLIKRLGDPDTYTAMPSSLALEHAARFCEISDNSLGLRALQKYLQQSREWVGKVGKEEAEKEVAKHYHRATRQVIASYQVANLLGKKEVELNSYSLLQQEIAKDWGNTIKRIIDEENAEKNDERDEDSFIH